MPKILIVDDDPTLVDFLVLLLESEGYETCQASDGVIALEQIAREQPELVLLDYMMPNMHGLDVLRKVSIDYQSSFVVMLTGKGSEEVAVQCMKAGASDYVVKPFDNEYLIGVIRNVLRLRDAELEKRKMVNALMQKQAEIEQLTRQALGALEENRISETIDMLRDVLERLHV
jgi:DNA-binding response OmpR family regulator